MHAHAPHALALLGPSPAPHSEPVGYTGAAHICAERLCGALGGRMHVAVKCTYTRRVLSILECSRLAFRSCMCTYICSMCAHTHTHKYMFLLHAKKKRWGHKVYNCICVHIYIRVEVHKANFPTLRACTALVWGPGRQIYNRRCCCSCACKRAGLLLARKAISLLSAGGPGPPGPRGGPAGSRKRKNAGRTCHCEKKC